MPHPALLGTLLAAGGVATAAIADRKFVRQWADNPDSLHGRPPRFPEGRARAIPTDDGATIHTVSAGTGPSVVLVHGLTSNMDDMGPLAERFLDAGYQVIGVDQRGHGQSTVGAEGFGIPRQAEDLAAVLNMLGVKDALYVGHSMGGMVGMQLALDYPGVMEHRVGAMALVATMADCTTLRARTALKLGSNPFSERMAAIPEDRMVVAGGLVAFGSDPNLTQIKHALATTMKCDPQSRIDATAGLLEFNVESRLPQITEPTVVVAGDQDHMTSLDANRTIASGIPRAELKIMEGAGHMVIWESVDEVAETIIEFAQRTIPAAASSSA